MQYNIDSEVFARYPGFKRAVIVAENINNSAENSELLALLRECEGKVRAKMGDDFKEHPRLSAWAEVFRGMNINPNKFPPSVVNLVKRVRGGKELPYVNTLVAAFNCISLLYLCPCGGDDLAAVKGDLSLTFAKGNEHYTPLGQPDVSETPPAGEIVYMDTATKEVFCRVWCWKNGDTSKLLPATTRAAINIDIMPPMNMEDAKEIAQKLAALLADYAGATTTIHYLDADNTGFAL